MDFHSNFSDDYAQSADTTFKQMKKFIHCMSENNLFIKYGIIYDDADGCNKQYICENAMWIWSVLEFTYRVIIDRCINATVNGRRKYMVLMDMKRHTENKHFHDRLWSVIRPMI